MEVFGERDVCVFWGRNIKFSNMFDNSFSMVVIFPQVQRCQAACILKQKCSRRNEKSKKHATVTPTIVKNDIYIFFENFKNDRKHKFKLLGIK